VGKKVIQPIFFYIEMETEMCCYKRLFRRIGSFSIQEGSSPWERWEKREAIKKLGGNVAIGSLALVGQPLITPVRT
jgi:hypothetical protein